MSRQAEAQDPLELAAGLARACREAGGRALLVGGAVRDRLLRERGVDPWPTEHPPPEPLLPPPGDRERPAALDLDIEVHGLPVPELEAVLRRFGRFQAVGRAFAVYKLRLGPEGLPVDVSLPRRDSKVGPGHRGIRVEGDPFMGLREAARRRDLRINALAQDPLTGEVLDPWDGLRDMDRRVLRPVDPRTFEEDPLRALRALRFGARFGFALSPELRELCAAMPVEELPAERVRDELLRALREAPSPGRVLREGAKLGLWKRAAPELEASSTSVAAAALDRAARLRARHLWIGDPRSTALLLAAALAPLEPRQREALLDRLRIHRWQGQPLRAPALALAELPELPRSDGELRLLAAASTEAGGLVPRLLLARALDPARDGAWAASLERARVLGLLEGPPAPLLRGAELRALGVPPGPELGALLRRLYRLQLGEGLDTREALLERARSLHLLPS